MILEKCFPKRVIKCQLYLDLLSLKKLTLFFAEKIGNHWLNKCLKKKLIGEKIRVGDRKVIHKLQVMQDW